MIRFAGTFSNVQTNLAVTPHVSQDFLAISAQLICDQVNRTTTKGSSPGVKLTVSRGHVEFLKAANNQYSADKVQLADDAMKKWLTGRKLIEGRDFDYTA